MEANMTGEPEDTARPPVTGQASWQAEPRSW